MSTGPQPPVAWSFTEPQPNSESGKPRRTLLKIIVGAVVVVVIAVLVAWLVWPSPTAEPPTSSNPAARPVLNDQPPTVFLNALDFRSLYPPGYVDFDPGQSDFGPDDIGLDMAIEYTSTSEPPGCTDDPLFEATHDFGSNDPDRYRLYPLLILMYPVDDPGGNEADSGFSISIAPATNTSSLSEFRDYYARCLGAHVIMTQTKDGRVIKEESATRTTFTTDAPASGAVDSFSLGVDGEEICEFVGLARGMIIQVRCPTTQRDAGINLFRTVVDRVNAI